MSKIKLILSMLMCLIFINRGFAQDTGDRAFNFIENLKQNFDKSIYKFTALEMENFLSEYPNHQSVSTVQYDLGFVYYQSDKDDETVGALLKALYLFPQHSLADSGKTVLREIFDKNAYYEGSRDTLLSILKNDIQSGSLADKNFDYLKLLFKLDHFRLGNWTMAEMRKFLVRFPNDHRNDQVSLWLALVNQKKAFAKKSNIFRRSRGEFLETEAYFSRLLFLYPKSELIPGAKLHLARIFTELNEPHSAIETLNELIVEYPENELIVPALFFIAEITDENLKEPLQAIQQYRRIVDFYGSHTRAVQALEAAAELHMEQKNYLGAIETWQQLIEKYPDTPNAFSALKNIAETYEKKLKQPASTAATYQLFVTHFPNSLETPDMLLKAAEIYETEVNDFPKALACYQILSEKYPEHHSVLLARTKIAEGYILLNQNDEWNLEQLDVARNENYLSNLEKDVILEVNKLRTNPVKYAQLYIETLKEFYNGKLRKYPDEQVAVKMKEGLPAVDECLEVLIKTSPVTPLMPLEGIYRGARDHVADQGEMGETGHQGSDNSFPIDRVRRYVKCTSIGENISYGYNHARKIVIQLLLDDGVPSRGHRKNLLNKEYRFIGVACGKHQKYDFMCVQDFAVCSEMQK